MKGKVQRAGFRYFVKDKAKELGLMGSVQNIRNYDEDVLVLVEGEANKINDLVEILKDLKKDEATSNLLLIHVDNVKAEFKEDFEGRFTDFNIIRDTDEIAERQDEGLHHLIKLREEVAENFHDLDVKYGSISKNLEALPSRIAEEIQKALRK